MLVEASKRESNMFGWMSVDDNGDILVHELINANIYTMFTPFALSYEQYKASILSDDICLVTRHLLIVLF